MKGQVAPRRSRSRSLAREGFEPAGDLIFCATADEEVGAGFGASWLCEEHGDAVRCDYLINEGSATASSSAATPTTSARCRRR
jgi:acetylornithine deacetylase/succinyl-diaminopimelate desuccinylase-like protein